MCTILGDQRIKLVVYNEYMLGFIDPQLPQYIQVLSDSILKGSPLGLWPSSVLINKRDNVRLASRKDFEDFRHSFEGYTDKEYIFCVD